MIQHAVSVVMLLVLMTARGGQDIKYCKLNCRTELHTMCKYDPGPAKACGGTINSSLSEAEKQDILKVHNEYRMKVASGKEIVNGFPLPKAADMRELEWDKELEQIALRLTEQCLMKHDVCRDSGRFPVGQNIAVSNGSTDHSETLLLITAWYNEVKFFHQNDVLYNGDPKISHFTQVIWANSQFIGCARVIWKNQQQLTCNYGPAGNYDGLTIYKPGNPCSECPHGSFCSPRYNSLCTYTKENDEIGSATTVLNNHYLTTTVTNADTKESHTKKSDEIGSASRLLNNNYSTTTITNIILAILLYYVLY